jgi:TM2 domain-containing membrane protein YozV
MNNGNDFNQPSSTPEPPPGPTNQTATAFCQQCGKPLTPETVRRVGSAVFCEPCLAVRLGHAPDPKAGYTNVRAGVFTPQGDWVAPNLAGPGPNPGLAALLGLIPGVGAFYNEQYAKGVVHVIVFMVLISLTDNVNGIFGILVAGWVFYMAIEAHHTARARRDGTPLPNPFGLNDIGERLGFGKAWPAGPSVAEVANDAAAAAAAAAARAAAHYPPPQPPPAQPWGSPTDYNQATYPQPPHPSQAAYTQPFVDAAYAKAYQDMGYAPFPGPQTPGPQAAAPPDTRPQASTPPPAYPPYAPVPPYNPGVPFDASVYPPPPPSNRFPAGAVVLIGLGTIFLLTTTGIFSGFPPEALAGCVLVGIGAWVFLRGMTDSGLPLASDGSPAYTLRVLRALKWSVWLAAVGILNLLNAFHILAWHYTWPFLIILLGVVILIQRTAYQAVYNQAFTNPVASPAPAADSTKGVL